MTMLRRMVMVAAGALALGGAARPTAAQGRPARPAVRAELAAVLLQSGRYDEAAREYRALLGRTPNSYEYRLGLARALAWGEHPREAEGELRALAARRPSDAAVDSLLRGVRESLEPRAVEAVDWVHERPSYAPYRLALARALAREKHPALAIAQYDTLLTLPGDGRLPARGVLVREQADAYVDAHDRAGGAARLAEALRLAPADTGLRHALAGYLADGHRDAEAIAQYDTLIAAAATEVLYVERARAKQSAGDARGAERDLSASIALRPTAGAYVELGDLYRARGDYRAARVMYEAARARGGPNDGARITAALVQLAREERPAALAPLVGDDPGWRAVEDFSADNLGVRYSELTLRRTVSSGAATTVGVAGIYRRLGEHADGIAEDAAGVGARAGVAREIVLGAVVARAALDGGALQYTRGGTLAEGSVSAAAWVGPWEASLELSSAPAFPSLMTFESLVSADGSAPLRETSTTATLGGPLGALDVAVSWQQSRLSDGNRRVIVQAYARYPLAPHLFAVYSGSGIGFDERSLRYWDPSRYVAHGAGLELATRQARGWSAAARLLPSWALSDEAPVLTSPVVPGEIIGRGPVERRNATQLGGSGEAAYRGEVWELAGAVSYGRGRAGDYQRFGASLAVRILR